MKMKTLMLAAIALNLAGCDDPQKAATDARLERERQAIVTDAKRALSDIEEAQRTKDYRKGPELRAKEAEINRRLIQNIKERQETGRLKNN